MATLLKKISSKNIVSNIKEVVKTIAENDQVLEIYKILGIANGFKDGESKFGIYTEFLGSFFVTNCVTGEEFEGGRCFLPEPLPGMLKAALQDSDSVEFALSVSVKRRDDLGIGYEYLVKPIVETKRADPLAHLKAALAAPVTPQLAAPAANDDTTEVPVKKGKGK